MANEDFYDEYYQKLRIENGLEDAQVDASIPKVTTLAGDMKPTETANVVEGEFARVDPYAAEELGNAEGDGVIKTIAKGVVNGTIKAGESMSALMADGLNKLVPAGSDFRFKAPIPATMDTNAGGKLVEGLTQFGLQYYTGGNLLKAGKFLQSGTNVAKFAGGMAKGVYADFTAFKGDEERLSNFLIQFDNPILNNEVTRYLAADGDDSDLEGRLKNVIEGGIAGVAIEALVPALRGLKRAKKAMFDGDKKMASEIMASSKEQVAEVLERNAETLKAAVDPEQMDIFAEAASREVKAKPVSRPVAWDAAKVETVKTQLKAIQGNPDKTVDFIVNDIGHQIDVTKLDGSDDVVQVMNVLSGNNLPKEDPNVLSGINIPQFNTWSHDTQLKIAESRGMDVPTLRRYMELGAVNEHVLLSTEILLKRQSEVVTDMINKNLDNNYIAAEVAKYQELLDMAGMFKNISGRTLDANRIKLDLKSKNIESAQRFMTERWGSDKNVNKFKEAWIGTGGDLGAIANLVKMSPGRIAADSVVEIWKNGLLSGVKTFGVNYIGNYANLYKEIGVRFFSGLSGQARSVMGNVKPGQERVYMGEALAMAQAQMDGLIESLTTMTKLVKNPSFLKDFNVPKSMTDKAELGYTRKISADYWGMGTAPGAMARYIERMTGIPGMKTQAMMRRSVDLAGSIINTPGNLLNITDGMVQNSARRTQRYALAYRKAMESGANPIDAQMQVRRLVKDNEFVEGVGDSVDDFAKRVTFQSEIGATAQGLQKVVKGFRPFMNIPVLEFLVPFIRTPVNIFKQGVTEVNPVITGLSALDPRSSVREGIRAGGTQADEVLGRAAFGLSVSTAAVMMATNGTVTGAGPTHDPVMMETLKRSGWRPYSFRVDNGVDANGVQQYKYYSYNRIEPAAWLFGSVASTIEKLHYTSSINDRKDEQWSDYAAAVLGSMTEATLDKSFFTGVQDFFNMMSDPKRYVGAWSGRMAASFVPAISRDIDQMLQDKVYLRDVRSAMDAINNKLIGQSEQLPVVRNRWGDPIAMDSGWMLGGRSYFSPIGMSDEYAQAIDKEIIRLAIDGVQDADGNRRVFTNALIQKPDRYVMKGGVQIRFDNFQYSRLLEIAGHEIKRDPFALGKDMTMREALNYLVTESEAYKLAGTYNPNNPIPGPFPETQARMIRNVAKGYDESARQQLFLEYPDLQLQLQNAERYDMMSKVGAQRPEDQYQILEQLNGSQ